MTNLKIDTEVKLLAIFTREFGNIPVVDMNKITLAQWDSVKHIDLIFEIEDNFDLEIDTNDIPLLHDKFETILDYVLQIIK